MDHRNLGMYVTLGRQYGYFGGTVWLLHRISVETIQYDSVSWVVGILLCIYITQVLVMDVMIFVM